MFANALSAIGERDALSNGTDTAGSPCRPSALAGRSSIPC